MKKFDSTLYFITDSTGWKEEDFLCQIEEAIKGGVTLLQLREKESSTREYIELAEKVHRITKKYQIPLIIDDRVDVAMAVGAEGVHLGQSDMSVKMARKLLGEDVIIGATTKTVAQALEAYEQGADYLGVGAIYPTTTKVKTILTSTDTLDEICKAVPIPVNAIGGLNKTNTHVLEGIGIAGICVVSAIMRAENPKKEAEILLDIAKKLSNKARKATTMKAALTIAGSDSGGGAGIQADIKTMTMNGVFAMSAITALTAQNTMGVQGIQGVSPKFLKQQMDAVFQDIYPNAVKIGMVPSAELADIIAETLKEYKAANIIVDPVMIATSGSRLADQSVVDVMKEKLFPIATLITPNIPEIEVLTEMSVTDEKQMEQAAKLLAERYHCAVLCKGGHRISDANDLLYADGECHWFYGKRIVNPNTHGTGCTLSSAIAANLAKGYELKEGIEKAKEYISDALDAMLDLGKGAGPLNHLFHLNGYYTK